MSRAATPATFMTCGHPRITTFGDFSADTRSGGVDTVWNEYSLLEAKPCWRGDKKAKAERFVIRIDYNAADRDETPDALFARYLKHPVPVTIADRIDNQGTGAGEEDWH